LPWRPYYDDQAFGDVKNVECADGAPFFSIVWGPRNEAEDIGWREACDLGGVCVYRKDLATGMAEALYSFNEYQ